MELVITLSKTVTDQVEAQTLTDSLKALVSGVPELDIQAETRADVSTQ